MPSICPDTICPPNLPSALIARSRFTCEPARMFFKEVLFTVSCMTSALNCPFSMAVTVRHIPFTAILSPILVPSNILEASMTITCENVCFLTAFTCPISSIIPVNILNFTFYQNIIPKPGYCIILKLQRIVWCIKSHTSN